MVTDPDLEGLIKSARKTGYSEALSDMMGEISTVQQRHYTSSNETIEELINRVDYLLKRSNSDGRS